ncbi:MAG: hypothetical protein ACXV5Q_06620, partial [Frankiaceae bacterium]
MRAISLVIAVASGKDQSSSRLDESSTPGERFEQRRHPGVGVASRLPQRRDELLGDVRAAAPPPATPA